MRGILISVALHTLVLLAAALGLPWLAKPPANAARNFEVDIVRLSDITQAGKGEKPKPRTERKPDAERETTRKPIARDRRAGKPPEKPEPVKPKPAEIALPPRVAEPKPKPKPPEKTATAKPKPPKPEPPKKTAVAKRKAPAAAPKPAKKAEPAPKPKAAPPKRVEIDPRALQRQTGKPKKRANVKKPEPPASKPAPKPVAKPKKKPETRMARPAPKPEKKTVPPRKPAPPRAKPEKKPEPKKTVKKTAPKKPARPEAKAAKPKKKPEPKPPETAKKAEPKVERRVAALPRPRPPAQLRAEKSAKQPPKAVKKRPARKDPLDSVFKTVGKLKKSQQSDRDRTAARTPAGVKTAARSLRMTLSEIQAVRRQIQPCWNFPAGAQNAGALRVRITIWLNRDGSVRDAKILDGADISGNAKLRAAADAGIRAVSNPRCSPLKLPPEKFDQWKVLTIDFDPSKLSSE